MKISVTIITSNQVFKSNNWGDRPQLNIIKAEERPQKKRKESLAH